MQVVPTTIGSDSTLKATHVRWGILAMLFTVTVINFADRGAIAIAGPEVAKALSLSLPNTAIAQQMFSSCIAHGGAELDHSALIMAIEGLAAHSIRESK